MISIVLPTYNQAHFLSTALDGIIAQTLRDFELIIVNDGSTDNTVQLLEEYSKKLPFALINQDNQGLPKALNHGFEQARGDYFTWTSSDNIMLPDMLETLLNALEQDRKIGVVYSDWYFINGDNSRRIEYRTIDFDRSVLLRMNYVHCSFLFRRECFEHVGGYDPELIYSEDWDFWIRVSRSFQMKHVPKSLYLYRVHSSSMTSEMLQGSARRKIQYNEFDMHLKHKYPLEWYLGKIRLRWMRYFKSSDPQNNWQQAVNLLSGE